MPQIGAEANGITGINIDSAAVPSLASSTNMLLGVNGGLMFTTNSVRKFYLSGISPKVGAYGLSVDATATGATRLYAVGGSEFGGETALSSTRFIMTDLIILIDTDYDGSGKTTDVTFDVGNNGASYNNWVTGQSFAFTAAGQYVHVVNTGTVVTEQSDVFINITTASDATVETWIPMIVGYLV